MVKKLIFVFGAVLLLGVGKAYPQSTPKYSNEFLSIGISARAFGMSNAVVSSTDDVTAGFWNPAGLVHIKDDIQLSFMHAEYFAGIANYDYGGFATQIKDKANLGISFVRFGVDNIPNTLDLIRNGQIDYNRISSFSAVDYAFLFSYAQKTLRDGLSIGGNAKIIHRRAGQFAKAWGFGLDFGLQYRTDNNWQLGLMARDVTSTFNAWSFTFTDAEKDVLIQTGNEIPENSLEITLPKFILGAGKLFDLGEQFSLLAEFNADLSTDGKRNTLIRTGTVSIDPRIGLEAGYKKMVFLRAGLGNIQEVTNIAGAQRWTFQPNVGLGLKFKNVTFDYALSDIGDVSDALYSNVFSVRFSVNQSGSE